jgi:hypothetical protein
MAYTLSANAELLKAALIGYEQQKAVMEERIAELRRELGEAGEEKPKRGMSADGRARVAAAQRKRWAALKKSEKTEAMPEKTKRKMSAAGRKRIIAATKKRWAAWHAAKAAAE